MTNRLSHNNICTRTATVIACLVILALGGCPGSGPGPAVKELATRLIPLDEQDYINLPVAIDLIDSELPPAVDLSEFFPPPGNQNPQPSCTAWAVGYALKTYQETTERSWSPDTIDHQFSPAFIYNQLKDCADCSCGLSIAGALDFLQANGCCTLDKMPYDPWTCHARPSTAATAQALDFRIADWLRVDFSNLSSMKALLADGRPVVLGIDVYDEFYNLNAADPVYDNNNGPLRSQHAVVVTGYDDQTQRFEAINSWSTDWGNGGYFYIPYNFLASIAIRAYVANDVTQAVWLGP